MRQGWKISIRQKRRYAKCTQVYDAPLKAESWHATVWWWTEMLYSPGSCLHSEGSACCCALHRHREVEEREGRWKFADENSLIYHRHPHLNHPKTIPEVSPVSPKSERSDGSSAAGFIVSMWTDLSDWRGCAETEQRDHMLVIPISPTERSGGCLHTAGAFGTECATL